MRILFASRRPAYPFFLGGAERSFFELAKALAATGHKVAMLGQCSRPLEEVERFFEAAAHRRHEWQSETVRILDREVPSLLRLSLELGGWFRIVHTFLPDFPRLFDEVSRSFRPEIVCTQLEGSLEVVARSVAADVPVLHFVRDTFVHHNFYPLAQSPLTPRVPTCVANSGFTADFLKQQLGIEAEVLHPLVELPEASPRARPGEGSRKRVLFVNPEPLKGGELMLEVARRLPDLDFVVLPGWGREVPERWRRLPNVEAWSWPVLRMEEAYVSADLVVVPTQRTEGFGRVAVEAQCCGVPVLASRHSALIEVLGESAVLLDDYRSPGAWIEALRAAFESPQRLEQLRRAGERNAKRFSAGPIVEQFEHIVGKVQDGGVLDGREERAR